MGGYDYAFAFDARYCYPDSGVLRNRMNITDAAQLSQAEREITSLKIAYAKVKPIRGRFNFRHLSRIHKFIFEDIYDWAGCERVVNISKGNLFCLSQNIDQYAEHVFEELKKENYLIGSPNVPNRLAYYLSEINILHPFREGNGRTQRLFIEYLANVAGYEVDFSGVSQEEMILASAESFAGDYRRINRMFGDITELIPIEEQQRAKLFFLNRRK